MDAQIIERATDRMTRARVNLITNSPFFGMLSLKLKLKPDPTHKTAYTDGVVLGYNPAWIEGLIFVEVVFTVGHEVFHVSNLHHLRREWREHALWNEACDYVVNLILRDNGFILPEGMLVDEQYRGMSAEHVYALLEEAQQQQQPQAGGGDGDPQEGGDGDGDGDPQDTSDQGGEDTDDQGSSTDPEDGDDQGGGDGEMGEDPAGWGEVRDLPNPDDPSQPATEDQKHTNEGDWITSTINAAKQAEKAGKLPAGLERLIEGIKKPAVDWRKKLARFMNRNAKNDYSWKRPNRRYIHQGIYLPSLHSPSVGNLVLAVDTSGSTYPALEQFASELNAILGLFDTEVDVLYCDTEISEDGGHMHFQKTDLPLTFKMIGGGGTYFHPPFEWVRDRGIQPSCLIYLTDLESDYFPDFTPPYPVLWINCRPHGRYGSTPPFGEVVDMNLKHDL